MSRILTGIAVFIGAMLVFRCVQVFSLWRMTIAEGFPVPVGRIFRMLTRRIPPATIAGSFVSARKRGFDVSLDQLEKHQLDGGHPDAVVGAMIRAHDAGVELGFDDVAGVDLSGTIPSTLETNDLQQAIGKRKQPT